jgi:hypothetical protein
MPTASPAILDGFDDIHEAMLKSSKVRVAARAEIACKCSLWSVKQILCCTRARPWGQNHTVVEFVAIDG